MTKFLMFNENIDECLGSEYCKVEATDLIQQPSETTLRMLKFPILRISDFRLALSRHRINSQKAYQ